jgi:hypothetical protein
MSSSSGGRRDAALDRTRRRTVKLPSGGGSGTGRGEAERVELVVQPEQLTRRAELLARQPIRARDFDNLSYGTGGANPGLADLCLQLLEELGFACSLFGATGAPTIVMRIDVPGVCGRDTAAPG